MNELNEKLNEIFECDNIEISFDEYDNDADFDFQITFGTTHYYGDIYFAKLGRDRIYITELCLEQD